MLLVGACAPPNQVAKFSPPAESPTPTPTTAFAASGPGFHAGEVGIGYAAVALTADGGVKPYKWAVSNGALPPGLTLGADGSLSGTPTAAGSFTFNIQAADSGDSTASIPGTINVAAHLTASLLPACAQYCRVELGCTNACGAFGTVGGGIAPFTYTVKQGPLPSGTTLSSSSLTLNGTFGGQPGYLPFTVDVGDAFGATATVTPTFWMYNHISLAGGSIGTNPNSLCWWTGYDPVSSPGCRGQFPYAGGTPSAGTPTVSASWVSYVKNCTPPPIAPPAPCTAPPMPSVTVGGGVVTVTVPFGTGYWGSGVQGTLKVVVTNQDVCSAGPSKCSTSALINIVQQGS